MDSYFYDPRGTASGRQPYHSSWGRYTASPFSYPANSRIHAATRPYPIDVYPSMGYAGSPPVVSIPVRYVGSDGEEKASTAPSADALRSSAAVAIQRVLRGYLVRKNMKIVSQVAAELGPIEWSVRSQEERLQADPKERLRANEMLMALLFRLDSVRGIRDFRKKVIRRVIALQEFLDSISVGTIESTNSCATDAPIGAVMLPADLDLDAVHRESEEIPNNYVEDSMEPRDGQDPAAGVADALREGQCLISATPEEDVKAEEQEAADDGNMIISMEGAPGTSPADKTPPFESMEQEKRGTTAAAEEAAPEVSTTAAMEITDGAIGEEAAATASRANSAAGASCMEEVLKKVMAESERLQGLVAALCQRNAQQCQLMKGLAERIERLERTMQKKEKRDKKRRCSACRQKIRLNRAVDPVGSP